MTWYVLPDGRHVTGRPPGYDFSSFLDDFSSFAKGLPGPLVGPATGAPTWMADTGEFLAAEPRVGMVTLHEYPLQTCYVPPSSPQYPTGQHLLAPDATTGLADSVAAYVALAHARHLPLRIDEINTDACGAAPGVSNAFVSALWALDALFEMARVGVDGVNIHTYPGATYRLFTFTHPGEGGPHAQTVSPWAFVIVVAISRDPASAHQRELGPPHDRAELRGRPSGDARATACTPASVAELTASQGRCLFTLPAESAALVTF